MIDQQRLGHKGEQRFGELCSDAGLTFNKSHVDLAGWDFIVNDDAPQKAELTSDRRQTPFSCYVQVKTIWETTKGVRLKLNMAERLGIEPLPAFIFVLKVDSALAFTSAYLIHIAAARLETILKRLRKARLDKSTVEHNKIFISFTPNETERIELSGPSLRTALARHAGQDFDQYIENKRQQWEVLGFGTHPYEVSASFENIDADELLDVFLGIKTNVSVSNLEITKTRFGIRSFEEDSTQATVSLSPNPSDTCVMTFRSPALATPVIFSGIVFTSPSVCGQKRSLIKSELFSIVLSKSKSGGISCDFNLSYEGKQLTAPLWRDFWRMLWSAYSGGGVLEIMATKLNAPFELTMHSTEQQDPGEIKMYESWVSVLEYLADITRHAGAHPEPTFHMEEIGEQAQRIAALAALLRVKDPNVLLSHTSHVAIDNGRSIVAMELSLGSHTFLFYAVAIAEIVASGAGGSRIVFREFTPKRFRMMRKARENIEAFERLARDAEHVPVLWL